MVKEVYFKEMHNKNYTAVISFEGNVMDIYELRDYAKVINSVKNNNCKRNYDKANYEMVVNPTVEIDIDEIINSMKIAPIVCHDDKDVCDIAEEEDLVNHPSHYTNHGMECILEMAMLYGFEETMSFCKLNAHKYRKRALDKGGRTDLDKSDWYVNTYKELAIAKEWGETPLQYVCRRLEEIN